MSDAGLTSKRLNIKDQRGFTLIELVTTIVILGILSLFSYGIIVLNARTFNDIKNNTVDNWDLRRAMQLLKNDVQKIRPENLIMPKGNNFSSAQLQFKSMEGNVIAYRKNADSFQRRVDKDAWITLLNGLKKPPFSYLNLHSTPTNNKNEVVFIQASFRIEKEGRVIKLDDKFYVRN